MLSYVILEKSNDTPEKRTYLVLRDMAVKNRNTVAAITFDNTLEELGMHPDHRKTCYTCQAIVTPEHSHPY